MAVVAQGAPAAYVIKEHVNVTGPGTLGVRHLVGEKPCMSNSFGACRNPTRAASFGTKGDVVG